MPCPAHPHVDGEDCPVCNLYWHIMRVCGPKDPLKVDVISILTLAQFCDIPRPLKDVPYFSGVPELCGHKTTANLVAAMIEWMRGRGVKLYRAGLKETAV